MKRIILSLKLLLLAYFGYLTFYLLTDYNPASPSFNPPFVLWVLDTIDLFIHEAGHLFLRPFGMFVHIIGGSLFQCLIPLALLIVTWRQNIHQVCWPGFWLGQSMVNVSVYIADAPVRKLKLIAKGLIHDWHWLLSGNLELAEPLSQVVWGLGIAICVASVGAGVVYAIKVFREAESSPPPQWNY